MCGIVGYVGQRPAQEILLAGLQKLEYRCYDSAGISVIAADGRIESVRAVGNLAKLKAAIEAQEADESEVASPSPRARPRLASATHAGPPTAASTSPTRTRTSTRPTACTSWSTASSRTTSR